MLGREKFQTCFLIHTHLHVHTDCSLFHSRSQSFYLNAAIQDVWNDEDTRKNANNNNKSQKAKRTRIYIGLHALESTCDATAPISITCRIYLFDASTVLFYKFTLSTVALTFLSILYCDLPAIAGVGSVAAAVACWRNWYQMKYDKTV